ncbi:MAG: hypothetical protein JWO00_547 [Candidatus Parcubacteria bacterium]|nr:hypothetical protein [Candidatus Parcubacteria bacterium]
MKTSKFQVIVLVTLIVFIIAGVIAFATFKGSASKNQIPPITIWGTFPKAAFDQYVTQINYASPQQMTVKYVQQPPDTFSSSFVAALARGTGPDAILIPADLLLASADKLTPIPYSVLPQRTFMNAYIDEAAVYLSPNGELGIPFITDPLVMYWNRDMYNAAGLVICPDPACSLYWDQFKGFNEKLTVKQDNGTISKSAVALGDFTNVTNAREILGTLFMQLGNPITVENTDGSISSALKPSSTADPVPAVTFFTQFVNPNSENYSWNRSWPASKTAFLAGNLATYFGLASELPDLRAKNPNLNFDIAPLPQVRTGGTKAAYARMYGFSIVKSSPNSNTAYQIISAITAPEYLAKISASMYLPSVSRQVIAAGSSDPYMTVFNQEALVAKTWLDVDPAQSSRILGDMIQSVSSGQKSPAQAVNEADYQYNYILQQAVAPTAIFQPVSWNVAAAGDVPDVNIGQKPSNSTSPFGYFRLTQCDGPTLPPVVASALPTDPTKFQDEYGHMPPYVPCDFRHLMIQAQYLINVMIVLGVLGALIGITYAGFLYIKGDSSDRNKAKDMLPKMFWGFILMLTAWFIVSQIMVWLTGSSAYMSGGSNAGDASSGQQGNSGSQSNSGSASGGTGNGSSSGQPANPGDNSSGSFEGGGGSFGGGGAGGTF